MARKYSVFFALSRAICAGADSDVDELVRGEFSRVERCSPGVLKGCSLLTEMSLWRAAEMGRETTRAQDNTDKANHIHHTLIIVDMLQLKSSCRSC